MANTNDHRMNEVRQLLLRIAEEQSKLTPEIIEIIRKLQRETERQQAEEFERIDRLRESLEQQFYQD